MDDECFLGSSWKRCAHEMSQGVMITTQGDTDQEMTHTGFQQESAGSLQGVWACTTSTRPLGPPPLGLGGPMPQHAAKTFDTSHTTTVSHGCGRSLLKPCAANSIDVVSSWACCIGVAINTERGIACSASTRAHRPDSTSASRLMVSTSSPLSYSMRRRFRHSRYFAVCHTFVSPSASFVCGGSLIHNFLSSAVLSQCVWEVRTLACGWCREPLSNRLSIGASPAFPRSRLEVQSPLPLSSPPRSTIGARRKLSSHSVFELISADSWLTSSRK